jgi:DNA (cytosine-5)-methyltransferase 1
MKLLLPFEDETRDATELVQLESGVLIPRGFAEEKAKEERKPQCVDVFSGCGGFGLGMHQAGFEVAAAIEYDTTATVTYMCNLCRYGGVKMHFVTEEDEERMETALQKLFKSEKAGLIPDFRAGSGWIAHEPDDVKGCRNMIVGDVRKLTGKRLLEIIEMQPGELDCMTGGPPCQGFSHAGNRRVADPRNNLVFEYARLIVEVQPKTMIMENVPGILSMVTPEGLPVVDKFYAILRDGGFEGVNGFEKLLKKETRAGFIRKNKNSKQTKPTTTECDDEDEE